MYSMQVFLSVFYDYFYFHLFFWFSFRGLVVQVSPQLCQHGLISVAFMQGNRLCCLALFITLYCLL